MANTFYIIKKVGNYFVHRFNDGAKEVELSDFEAILEFVSQTFSIQCKNGSNIEKTPVSVNDIVVIDETGAGTEEIFLTLTALRNRLVQLQYTPYKSATGIEEAPIDGNTYGRKDAAWEIITGVSGNFSKTLQWDGTSTITVPTGFSGKVLNENINQFATYTVLGTALTVTGNAYTNDYLTLTS